MAASTISRCRSSLALRMRFLLLPDWLLGAVSVFSHLHRSPLDAADDSIVLNACLVWIDKPGARW